ncbi:TOMM precursor leader peptide-binding protein [Streptomonospora salina]|uniref:Bacteriocin biosynthesis cyclodehydratase domain-containing protein n=1 Tax=Streptomonospora salina TaxID=104205 RepID=A0A841E5F1_9ACTN|nr:TOMM precursor leader peptide-binding protein [Streptomonospora salina]MBB5998375.1 bacteriocin biosynthesis cyclodehydratase domain-containing protein [Streptomonospora salina]
MTTIETSKRSWLVNTEARVLASGQDILVRHGGVVSRCSAPGIRRFVVSLLDQSVDGRIDLDPAETGQTRLAQFETLMAQLVAAGLFVEATPDAEDPGADDDPVVLGVWQRGGGAVDRTEISARLRTRPVRLLGSGSLVDDLRTALTAASVTIADDDPTAPAVVVGRHEQDSLLTEWNADRLADGMGVPWLAVVPFTGGQAIVGPWIVPGESACYECYLLRRASNFGSQEMSSVLAEAEPVGPVFDGSARYPGLRMVQTGLIVDRIVERVGLEERAGQSVPGELTTISLRYDAIDVERHRLLRVPRCPRCSPSAGIGYPQVWFAKEAGQ